MREKEKERELRGLYNFDIFGLFYIRMLLPASYKAGNKLEK